MQVLKEDVRSEILRQSRQEFLQKGFREASLRKIAARAGMTVGNLYRYFGNKDELFREVLAPIIGNVELMKLGLKKHEQTQKGSDLEEQEHDEFVTVIYNFIERYRPDLRLLLFGAGGSSLEGYLNSLVVWYSGVLEKDLKKSREMMGLKKSNVSEVTLNLIAKSVADSFILCVDKEFTLQEIKLVARELQSYFAGGVAALIKGNID